MNFYAFSALSPVVQLYWVIHHGTYLAQRWSDESGIYLTYDLPNTKSSSYLSNISDVLDGQAATYTP